MVPYNRASKIEIDLDGGHFTVRESLFLRDGTGKIERQEPMIGNSFVGFGSRRTRRKRIARMKNYRGVTFAAAVDRIKKKFPLLSQVSWCLAADHPALHRQDREGKSSPKPGFDNQHFCSRNKGRERGKFSFSQSNVGRSPNPLGAIIPPGDHRVISALVSVFSNATLALPPFSLSSRARENCFLGKGGSSSFILFLAALTPLLSPPPWGAIHLSAGDI